MSEWTLESAKAALAKDLTIAKRLYAERVGPLIIADDDNMLTRWAAVWFLRNSGLTFREIGEKVGVSGIHARDLFMRATATFDDPEEGAR